MRCYACAVCLRAWLIGQRKCQCGSNQYTEVETDTPDEPWRDCVPIGEIGTVAD